MLEVEAMISNRDIGFVHPGQDAQIKVDTFNFTRYGVLHGKVVSVSSDSIVRDVAPDKARDNRGMATRPASPKARSLVTSPASLLIKLKSK